MPDRTNERIGSYYAQNTQFVARAGYTLVRGLVRKRGRVPIDRMAMLCKILVVKKAAVLFICSTSYNYLHDYVRYSKLLLSCKPGVLRPRHVTRHWLPGMRP
jgi:hypothetical protein